MSATHQVSVDRRVLLNSFLPMGVLVLVVALSVQDNVQALAIIVALLAAYLAGRFEGQRWERRHGSLSQEDTARHVQADDRERHPWPDREWPEHEVEDLPSADRSRTAADVPTDSWWSTARCSVCMGTLVPGTTTFTYGGYVHENLARDTHVPVLMSGSVQYAPAGDSDEAGDSDA